MSGHHDRKPTLLSRFVRWIIFRIYRWQGWKVDGHLPDIPKFVIAGAPHTSNWDFVFFIGATKVEGVKPNFMGKHTLFKGIMRNFMLDMGGIPVDRSQKTNVVEQVAQAYAEHDKLALVIACEGTRTSNGEWKSGFYNIAQAAGVPIVPAYADNEGVMVGFGPPLTPSGNFGEDLLIIAQWMRSKLPNYERYKVLEAQARRLIEEAKNG